ncbi:MAG: molybdopterin-binding protein [Actinomycetota bacterium]|nr:molybdopterin-binding protein [Actinomycetota bacterium]
MSTPGLDGILPWAQARQIASTCARPLPKVAARLDEAGGHRLAAPLVTLQDDPPADCAASAGFAVRGEGPWLVTEATDVVTAGHAVPLAAGEPVPRHTDAVLAAESAVTERRRDGRTVVVAVDPLNDLPDEALRPEFGSGIVTQAQIAQAGHVLAPAGTIVTTSLLALAAAAGHDDVPIIRPPVVGVLVLGGALLDRGLPRHHRVRDALGPSIPAFIGSLGARGNPAVRAPDTADLLLREIEDAAVDVLITTGSTAPGPENHLRRVLGDLGARWLVDGVAVTPGAQMLLARLPDGRFLIGLPGQPASALAGLVTLASPLIRALRDDPLTAARRTAVLVDDAPLADYADDTALVPVAIDVSSAATSARPLPGQGPAQLTGWAGADAIAVVPPGAGVRGDVVELLDVLGREDWPGWSA